MAEGSCYSLASRKPDTEFNILSRFNRPLLFRAESLLKYRAI